MKRTLLIVPLLAVAALSSALTLTTPYDEYFVPSYISPNGGMVEWIAPTLVSETSSESDEVLAALLGSSTPRTDGSTSITKGGALTGDVAVRGFRAGQLGENESGEFLGAETKVDISNATGQDDLRWVVIYNFTAEDNSSTSSFLFTQAFETDRPYYYNEGADLEQRANGAYTLEPNIYGYNAFGDPKSYIWELLAFPVTVAQDANGVASRIVVHDGVSLQARVTPPVPEPASFAVLGIGAAALLRRRRRSY